MSKIKIPKQSCLNCHFLVKILVSLNPIPEMRKLPWDNEDKTTFQPKDPRGDHVASECYREFWSTRVSGYEGNLKKIVLQNRKKDNCFFKDRHKDGMTYPAGLELVKKKEEKLEKRKEKRKENLLKIIIPLLTFLAGYLADDFRELLKRSFEFLACIFSTQI